jgi:isoprenylcysteine carboxyl methyltransferase (ICMT) family protein YpbQ
MKKSNAWFTKVRGSYLPSSWQGWLSYVPFVAYLVGTFFIINKHPNTFIKVAYEIIPEWIAAGAVMTYIAQAKSRKTKKRS